MLAKNAQMDSLDELRLIEGWDEEVHAVFAPHLTIFPYKQGSTDSRGGSATGGTDFKLNINTTSRALLQCLVPTAGGDCAEKSAIALAKRNADNTNLSGAGQKIEDILKETLCYTPDASADQNIQNRAKWFTTYSNVYRIETRGNVEDSEKKLVAIIERTVPDAAKKEKSSYKLLYLKVM